VRKASGVVVSVQLINRIVWSKNWIAKNQIFICRLSLTYTCVLFVLPLLWTPKMINRDRKALMLALLVVYMTVLIPITVFVRQMIAGTYTWNEYTPDLFRDPNMSPEDELDNSLNRERENQRALSEAEAKARREFQIRKEKEWRSAYFSPRCEAYRNKPPGLGVDGRQGMGIRSACSTPVDFEPKAARSLKTANASATDTEAEEEQRSELLGSYVTVSLTRKAIYVPVMKGASQYFEELVKKRLKARRMADRNVLLYLKNNGHSLSDFFVFTFVRNPFEMFESAYVEVNKYPERNRTSSEASFLQLESKPENEPRRAIAALNDARNGLFNPTHMYTQLWKSHRCSGRDRRKLNFNFIGHLDKLEEDWKFVEQKLNITHRPIPALRLNQKFGKSVPKLTFAPVTDYDSPWSLLTKHVCDYYQSDFDCFGFNKTLCLTR
jgi:hypothetical protein